MARAMREAGYAPTTVHSQKLDVTGPIREGALAELARQGVTLEAIVERLRARLYSTTVKNVKVPGGEATIEIEDNASQLRTLELLCDILGLKAPTRQQHEINATMNIEECRKEQQAMWDRLGGLG